MLTDQINLLIVKLEECERKIKGAWAYSDERRIVNLEEMILVQEEIIKVLVKERLK